MLATGPGAADRLAEQTQGALRALDHARASGALSPSEWSALEDAVLHALRALQMRAFLAESEAKRLKADLAEVRGALRSI